ncbi:MAG: tetratricopeptide repeat protein [Acidobacteria bacterium]|nr:tetratricopeptide repeat protein [Acidobacteriota bacterium]
MPKWNAKRGALLGSTVLLLIATSAYWVAAPGTASNRPTAQNTQGFAIHDHLRRVAGAQAQPLIARLRSRPDDPALLAEIGKTYYSNYDFADAIPYYRKSLSMKDDANVRTNLGGLYYYSGDTKSALAEFEQVLKQDPGNDSALFNLGLVRWQGARDAAGAIAAWRELLRTHPDHPRRAEVEQWIRRAENR